MLSIDVHDLCRDFDYYEKEEGIKGSYKNLIYRKKKIKHAVANISFTIEAGEMVGFIGPNGAGKSTTLKMLSGILVPTSGKALVNGFVPWERKRAFKHTFAFVAGQKSQLWVDLPARESLYINKCIYEIPDVEYKATINELSEMLGVQDYLDVQVRRLSLGERMKMELIAALLHKPSVFLLDEPTIGLDIISQKAIRNYLHEYNQKTGSTIILTSHYMKDIESLCKRAIIINEGTKVYDGTLSNLVDRYADDKVITLNLSSPISQETLSPLGEILEYNPYKIKIRVPRSQVTDTISKLLHAYHLEDFIIENCPLEDVIESIYRKG